MKKFKYFGAVFTSDMKYEAELHARIARACTVMHQIEIQSSREVGLAEKNPRTLFSF